jgi:uncharacterized membrane protein YidH (DUF202 family)
MENGRRLQARDENVPVPELVTALSTLAVPVQVEQMRLALDRGDAVRFTEHRKHLLWTVLAAGLAGLGGAASFWGVMRYLDEKPAVLQVVKTAAAVVSIFVAFLLLRRLFRIGHIGEAVVLRRDGIGKSENAIMPWVDVKAVTVNENGDIHVESRVPGNTLTASAWIANHEALVRLIRLYITRDTKWTNELMHDSNVVR